MAGKIERGIGALIATPRTGASGGIAPVSGAPIHERDAYLPPQRRGGVLWPSGEQLTLLVERARAAFSRGIVWDRGSIVNILL